jgi:hypothetical protein
VPEYTRHLVEMEETMNDQRKYFQYRRRCLARRSLPEFLCSRLPLEVKLKRAWQRINPWSRA